MHNCTYRSSYISQVADDKTGSDQCVQPIATSKKLKNRDFQMKQCSEIGGKKIGPWRSFVVSVQVLPIQCPTSASMDSVNSTFLDRSNCSKIVGHSAIFFFYKKSTNSTFNHALSVKQDLHPAMQYSMLR